MNREMEGCYTSAEQLPKVLVDVCLNCRRIKCSGNCAKYINAVREYKASAEGIINSRDMTGIRTGFEPKRYEYMGQLMSVREISEAHGISITTLRTWLRRGLSIEETIRRYDQRKKRRAQ